MNSAVKKIMTVLAAAILVSAVALAQTDASTGNSPKSKKKHAAQQNSSSAQNGATSSTGSSNGGSTPTSTDTATQSSSALPQSDSTSASSANASTVKAGNSGFDDTSSQNGTNAASTPSSQSSQTASPYGSGSGTSPQSSDSQTGMQSPSNTISNGPVAETVSDSSALIGWSTSNAASNTGVKYGTNRANLSQTAQSTDGSDGKNHHVKLDGLSPSTRYYFQVTENGQPVGGVGTFRTTANGEQPVQSKAVIPQK